MVGAPHLENSKRAQEHEARRDHVGQLVTAQALQLSADGGVVLRSKRKQLKAWQVGQRQAERSRRILTEPS